VQPLGDCRLDLHDLPGWNPDLALRPLEEGDKKICTIWRKYGKLGIPILENKKGRIFAMYCKRIPALFLFVVLLLGLLSGCSGGERASSATPTASTGESTLKDKRVRVIIGSTSTGGDSYRIADIVTRYLSEELGFRAKIDTMQNADALQAISHADGDGSTMMIFHDMAYLSVLFGAVDEAYGLENLTIGPRVGINPGGCFAANASVPYNSLKEAAQWLADNANAQLRVNIEPGSYSHLCFVVWYMWLRDTYGEDVASRVQVVAGGTTDEKKQRLWDGNVDIIYADYSSCVEFIKEGVDPQLAMKIFDTCGEVQNANVISMAEDGFLFHGKAFDFNKDFFMLFPKGMNEAVLEELTAAVQKICNNTAFQDEMAAMGYNAVTPEEAGLDASSQYILSKRDTSVSIVEEAPPLDSLM